MDAYKKINDCPSIVIINTQGINKRIDADYYHVNHIKFKESNITFSKISVYCNLSKNKFNPTRYSKEYIKYIDISNIDIVSGDYENQVISKGEAPSRARKKTTKNDIIISTVRPNRNAVSLINVEDSELVVSTGFAVIQCKKEIDNYYLFAVLKTNNSIEQLVRKTSGALYPAVSEQDIMDIEIPIASPEIQKYIGDKVRKAEQLRETEKILKKEVEDILRREIEDKQFDKNNYSKTEKYIQISEKPNILHIEPRVLDDSRIEATFYKKSDLDTELKVIEYRNGYKELGRICEKITDGTHQTPNYLEKGVAFISSKNIGEDLSFDDIKYISKEEHQQISKRCGVKSGDILFTKIGRIGYAKVVPEDTCEFSIFVSVALLKLEYGLDPYYIEAFLNSEYGKTQSVRHCKGSNQPDFHLEDICKIKIPIPTHEVQANIGDRLRKLEKIRKGIKQLIQQAKQDVEDLIEGDFDMKKLTETTIESRC